MRGLQHLWVPSNLGHGEAMCSRCGITDREARALHVTETCTGQHPNERAAAIREAAAIARQHAANSAAVAQKYVRSPNLWAQHAQAEKVAIAIAKEIEALDGAKQPEPGQKNA